MYIERSISPYLQQAVATFPCVVVTGSRQVGKTTLIRRLFPDHHYVTLDRPLVAEQADQDPEAFLQAHPAPVIIDEIQYAPSLFRFLKIKIDENRDKKGQFILTGSQKFLMMTGIGESLAGRAAIIEMEGLSCLELLDAGSIQGGLEDYQRLMVRGGFPELWAEPDRAEALFFDSYIATYLERDVRQVLAVGSLRDYERFVRGLALRTSQTLNKSDLAKEVGVSVSTIGEWLSVLEALGHIVLLEPWFVNLNKRLVKTPKVYFSESALACALIGISIDQLPQSPLIGGLWETFVFAELRKRIKSKGERCSLWYYRDQSQNEVDFIIEQAHELHLIECKWTSSPKGPAKNLQKVERIFTEANSHYRVVSKRMVSRAPEELEVNDTRFISPMSERFLWPQPGG